MPRTQVNCPQCRQPIVADVNQIFDVGESPQVKQIFLSGAFNTAQCPHCGFQGMLSTPLVYHDPEKELLLTFFPQEMAMARDEQERIIGPLINQVVDSLPQEKRKGYLLNPKAMLTLQTMLESVLEADGITKEMIKAQEDRINLVQRLMSASDDSRHEIIQQEDEMIDSEFFAIFARLLESAVVSRDEDTAQKLNQLQGMLLEHSTTGRKLQAESEEVQAAMQSLQDLGEDISREKLLELVIEAPTDIRVRAIVSMARPGMDYSFFQLLSQQIDIAQGQDKSRLTALREKLLTYTQEVDQEIEARTQVAAQNLESILNLKPEEIEPVIQQNIRAIDEFFIQAAESALNAAHKSGDLERSSKIQTIIDAVENARKLPPEFEFIDEMLEIAEDETALKNMLESRPDDVTQNLVQTLTGLVNQTHSGMDQVREEEREEQEDALNRLKAVHNEVLAFSMRRSFKGN
jgi:hypothetical protein